jgi:hypothetical protein
MIRMLVTAGAVSGVLVAIYTPMGLVFGEG